MNNAKLDIKEGSINFWIKEQKIKFNDNKVAPIFQTNPQDGSLFIVKDSDNKLKFFHVYIGKGRTDVEYDVSSLDFNKRHMITVTWSVKSKEIAMYVDSKKAASSKISYA